MMYEWHIGPADVYSTDTLTDIVSQIHWSCVGTAPNGSTFKASGAVQMGPPNPSSFIPFSKLTKSQIEDIVYSHVDVTTVEGDLSAQYSASLHPPTKPFNF